MHYSVRSFVGPLALLLTAVLCNMGNGHFVWVDAELSDGRPVAMFFFGESPFEQDYHLPESLNDAPVRLRTATNEVQELQPEVVEEDGFVGRKAGVSVPDAFQLESVAQYGIYHGTLLTYHAKGIHATSPNQWNEFAPTEDLALEIVPRATESGLECTVLIKGEPLEGTTVAVLTAEDEPQRKKTDENGVATFQVPNGGPLGLYANWTDESQQGEHDGKPYTSVTHYATLTLDYQPSPNADSADAATPAAEQTSSEFPKLPKAIASFGGAVLDGWLYCYSGHTGRAHTHSSENLAQHFVRLNLNSPAEWEELPMQTPLQGMALVADEDRLYRVGGMQARNLPDEDDDLHSVAEFAAFDPETRTWETLPSLPEPRSSHDAVVLDNKLYVLGGWELEGPGHGEWHETAWVCDLASPQAGWQPLPAPPFTRRALAVAHWQGKIVAIGGMTADGDVSRGLDIFDPQEGTWSQGPELPGEEIHGFGVSAWNLTGELLASGLSGVVYQLSADGTEWLATSELAKARFFHRLLPAPNGDLLAVAGASFEHGHLAETERITMSEQEPLATAGVTEQEVE